MFNKCCCDNVYFKNVNNYFIDNENYWRNRKIEIEIVKLDDVIIIKLIIWCLYMLVINILK